MSNEKKPNINKGFVPYGPGTGKSDPGRDPQRFVDDTPYEGTVSPDGKTRDPYHEPGGPGHKDCDHE